MVYIYKVYICGNYINIYYLAKFVPFCWNNDWWDKTVMLRFYKSRHLNHVEVCQKRHDLLFVCMIGHENHVWFLKLIISICSFVWTPSWRKKSGYSMFRQSWQRKGGAKGANAQSIFGKCILCVRFWRKNRRIATIALVWKYFAQ